MQCQKLQQVLEVLYFGLDPAPQSFCHSFIVLSIIHCSKSAQTSAVLGVSSRYCCYENHADVFNVVIES